MKHHYHGAWYSYIIKIHLLNPKNQTLSCKRVKSDLVTIDRGWGSDEMAADDGIVPLSQIVSKIVESKAKSSA